jgi:FkbM family methyltransferase
VNFSTISDQNLPGKLLRLPLRLIPPDAAVPILQGRLKGKKWIVGSSNHGCWLGAYEYEMRRAFESHVKEGAVVFDVGAHVGFYTLLSSVLAGSRGKAIAFEPNPRNLVFLKEHIRINEIRNVQVMEVAVSDCKGVSFFQERSVSSTGRLAVNGKLQVETVSLDEIIPQGLVPAPECVKIDVEGAEMLVLTGARFTLLRYRPIVFLETHGKEVRNECCRFLKSVGYEVRLIGEGPLKEIDHFIATREG